MNLVIKIHPGCIYFCYRSGFDFLYSFSIKIDSKNHSYFYNIANDQEKFNYLFISFFPDCVFDFRNIFGEVKSGSFKHNLTIVERDKVLGIRQVILG